VGYPPLVFSWELVSDIYLNKVCPTAGLVWSLIDQNLPILVTLLVAGHATSHAKLILTSLGPATRTGQDVE
jgi:hypothetical protein